MRRRWLGPWACRFDLCNNALCRREGLKPESLLPVEQRVPRSRQEAADGRHDARSDVDGSDRPAVTELVLENRLLKKGVTASDSESGT